MVSSSKLLSGPVAPVPHHDSDEDDNRGWNSYDERDYENQQYSPPSLSPMAHRPGSSRNPLVRLLSDIADWSVLDKVGLDNALTEIACPHFRPCSCRNFSSGRNQGWVGFSFRPGGLGGVRYNLRNQEVNKF